MQSRASLITTNFRTDKVWELPMEIKACEDFELTSRYTKLNSTDLTGKITRRRDLTWSASSVLYGALSALNLVRVVWANLNFLLWDAAYPLGRSTPKSSFIPPSACFPLDPTKADNTLNFLWFQSRYVEKCFVSVCVWFRVVNSGCQLRERRSQRVM